MSSMDKVPSVYKIQESRYHYRREGLRWVVRAGTGTRPLFKVWRQRTAMVLCTELLCAFLDGDFARREKQRSDSAGESNGS